MPFLAPDIGIDLGTENINVYVRGRGIVISEPTLVVLDRENRQMRFDVVISFDAHQERPDHRF